MKNVMLNRFAMMGILMLTMLFISCKEREQEINLAENEDQRQEVYQQILGDEELFTEFMTEMHQNKQMMRNMYTREQVKASMMADPEIMDSLMLSMHSVIMQDSMLLHNPKRRERMMQHMTMMMQMDSSMMRQMQQRMQERKMTKGN